MIVLQFVRGKDFGADAIAWFSHGANFSHVDTVLPDGGLLGARSDVVDDVRPGVRVRNPSYVGDCRTLRVELPCAPAIERAYLEFLHAQIGKPYDVEGIMDFIGGRDWHEPDAWFCSELAAAGLEHAGYFEYPLTTPTNKITPSDLLLALSARTKIDVGRVIAMKATTDERQPA